MRGEDRWRFARGIVAADEGQCVAVEDQRAIAGEGCIDPGTVLLSEAGADQQRADAVVLKQLVKIGDLAADQCIRAGPMRIAARQHDIARAAVHDCTCGQHRRAGHFALDDDDHAAGVFMIVATGRRDPRALDHLTVAGRR